MVEYRKLSLKYRFVLRFPYFFYNKLTARLYGEKLIQITTIGRVSKKDRKTLLEVVGKIDDTPVVISAFGENSDWVLNLRKNPEAEVLWTKHSYISNVEWLSENEAQAVLSDYKKENPKLVKLYETLFKRSWVEFSKLPVCMFPGLK